MPSVKLSQKFISNVSPPPRGRVEHWDTHTTGLGLRVTEKGAKSWVVMYRVNGRQRRLTLGPYPRIPLSDARDMALEALNKVSKGIDPATEKQAARVATESAQSLADVVSVYVERRLKPQNRSWKETERIFNRYVLLQWGKRELAEITRADIVALLDRIMDAGRPYMANRVRAALSAFFNWCVANSRLDASPAQNLPAPFKEKSRDRVLSDDEVTELWKAWDQMGWPFGLAFKLMLVTGQRRSEVAKMRWEDLDLAKALWTLPREATKADRRHEVPLTDLAIEILSAVPRNGEYVFTTNGRTPISGFSRSKKRSDELSEVTDWHLHDMRRTVSSNLARLGIPPHITDKVLNHASGEISGVRAVYNRYGYAEEKKSALNLWAAELEKLK
jgi:integrase